ncbi:MAG TPA: 30S ribosomal protein S6 [Anaerolineae bacterium]|nr:30S ribosomal protein S6 [Anaerolineae bacterium]HIQ04109.1 30S ribosomal protein S6 [Anaerolineae bacterium]
MNRYELMYIIRPDVEDEGIDALAERVNGWVVANGGEVIDSVIWGRRKLAYPVRKQLEGTYMLHRFQMPPQGINELERNLRLSEEILRHIVVREDEKH